MGLGGISIWQLLIVLAIVVMLFGTKRLRSLGSDLGAAIKGFRKSLDDNDSNHIADGSGTDSDIVGENDDNSVIDGEAEKVERNDP